MYTTSDLLASIKTRGMLPDASTGSLSPANLLIMATDELHNVIVPMILAAREKYYETYKDTLVTANIAKYAIPGRAIGGILSALQYMYGINIINLNPMDASTATATTNALSPRGFWFENNNVILYPPPSSSNYTIRMRYYQRPSALALTSDCGQITGFDTGAKTVTVSAIPSTWTTGTILDFVPAAYPYTPYSMDNAVLSVVGTTIAFTALPTDLVIGDWVAIAETTPIPELPNEFFPVLAQATVCKALEALGDQAGLMASKTNLSERVSNALRLITPRDQSGPKKVVSNWRNW
jgi:hypothetical protein